MLYQVSRNGQMYGPYTLEDLRRYLASGNVLATDLCKNDAMPEWKTVGEVLGVAPVAGFTTPTPYATGPVHGQTPVGGAAAANAYPDPPDLSWGLVMLFTILTCGIFMVVWNIIVAAWMRRVQPNSQALLYYIAGAILTLVNGGASFGYVMAFQHHRSYQPHILASLIGIASWVVRLIARFSMKASLEQHYNGPEPLGLTLNGAMTFFFGGLYHQYHLNRINEIKRAMRFGGGLR